MKKQLIIFGITRVLAIVIGINILVAGQLIEAAQPYPAQLCPELSETQVNATKAQENGWTLVMGNMLFKNFQSEAVSDDAPAGYLTRVVVIFDETSLFIINSVGRDKAQPPNYYRCICPPNPPRPCFPYSQDFKDLLIDEVELVSDGDGFGDDLLDFIDAGDSIMGLWPHPDDECFIPGIFTVAGGDRENPCWVVVLISLDSPPYIYNPEKTALRRQAIAWFEETYLEEYINLNMTRVNGRWEWTMDEIKAAYKAVIEEKQPDILLTFTRFGFNGGVQHVLISDIVTEIWHELTYEPKPKIYWFINMDQGPMMLAHGELFEYVTYPPTSVLDLDVYSSVLGKTYWEAKVEIWEQYAPSIGVLNTWMNIPGNLENNDRHEYFMRVK